MIKHQSPRTARIAHDSRAIHALGWSGVERSFDTGGRALERCGLGPWLAHRDGQPSSWGSHARATAGALCILLSLASCMPAAAFTMEDAAVALDGTRADAGAVADGGGLVVPAGAVLVATSAIVTIPLGLAGCISARLVLPDGSTVAVGAADGLVAETTDAGIVEVRTLATPIGQVCNGIVLAGLSEGSTAVTLRVEGRADLAPARASARVARFDDVRFSFLTGGAVVAPVGADFCMPTLRVLVSGVEAFALAEAMSFELSDRSVMLSTRLLSDGTLCIRGERAGRVTLRAVHTLGETRYIDSFDIETLGELRAIGVTVHGMPTLAAPGACFELVELSVQYSDGAGRGTYARFAPDDPRVECTPIGSSTLLEAGPSVCVRAEAPLGAELGLRCCFEGVCTDHPALAWQASPGEDRLALAPESYAPPPDWDGSECIPVRVDLVSPTGTRHSLAHTGLVEVVIIDPSLAGRIGGSARYEAGSLCVGSYSAGAPGSPPIRLQFSVRGGHTTGVVPGEFVLM